MANEYYERLSEMNPGDLADGLAMEAEFNAIAQGFSKLPTPHTGGQGFDGPVRIGDGVNSDEAVSKGQLDTAIGKAKLLAIATYGNLNAAAWSSLPSGSYLLFGTGVQLTNFPVTLTPGATYYVSVQHTIGDITTNVYQDVIAFHSADDPNHVDRGRLMSRVGSSLATAPWRLSAFKMGGVSALEPLVPAADRIPYYSGPSSAALAVLTPFARTLLDDADAQTVRATIGTYGKADAVGPVSQSGGVNTGAIAEIGDNANGFFIKYAGGGLEAFAAVDVSNFAVNTLTGAIYQASLEINVPLPAVFVGGCRPYVLVRYISGGARPWASLVSLSTNNASFLLHSALAMSAFSGQILVGAIGRWY